MSALAHETAPCRRTGIPDRRLRGRPVLAPPAPAAPRPARPRVGRSPAAGLVPLLLPLAVQAPVYGDDPPARHDGAWQPAFADDFERDALGDDWRVLDGQWRIAGGRLVGQGVVLCTRRFPGSQRIDYETRGAQEAPCDLSAFLCADASGFKRGVFDVNEAACQHIRRAIGLFIQTTGVNHADR